MIKTSVFVVHACPLVRKGIVYLAAQDPSLAIVGEAGDTVSAMRGFRRVDPQLGLVEYASDTVNGELICSMLKNQGAHTKIIFLADRIEGEDIYRAMAAGMDGFLHISESPESILLTIRTVIDGEMTISSSLQGVLQNYLKEREVATGTDKFPSHVQPMLSEIELEVLKLLAKGASIENTGHALNLSPSTVKNHRQSLFAKLGVKNAPAAVYTAVQRKILNS